VFFLPAQEKNQRSLLPLNHLTFEKKMLFFSNVLSCVITLTGLIGIAQAQAPVKFFFFAPP